MTRLLARLALVALVLATFALAHDAHAYTRPHLTIVLTLAPSLTFACEVNTRDAGPLACFPWAT